MYLMRDYAKKWLKKSLMWFIKSIPVFVNIGALIKKEKSRHTQESMTQKYYFKLAAIFLTASLAWLNASAILP